MTYICDDPLCTHYGQIGTAKMKWAKELGCAGKQIAETKEDSIREVLNTITVNTRRIQTMLLDGTLEIKGE